VVDNIREEGDIRQELVDVEDMEVFEKKKKQ
jgi:hypothetical protein